MFFNYQGSSKLSGIYEIRNRFSNRSYIGQAIRFKERWSDHKNSLLKTVHKNSFFQNDFNKCVSKLENTNFLEFHILEAMENSTKEERNIREEFWINKYIKAKYELYNVCLEPTKNRQTIDIRRGKTFEEFYGLEKANAIKLKISENKLIEMNRPEVKQNLRDMYLGTTEVERYGEEKAQQIKEKKSKARKGKYLGVESSRFRVFSNIKLLSPDGVIYTEVVGIKDFATLHQLTPNKLCELLSGKRKSHKGWKLLNL